MLELRLIIEDSRLLKSLTIQTAASIIESLKTMPTDPNAIPDKGIGGIVAQHVNWASHGYTNALQAQVRLIYDVAKRNVESPQEPPINFEQGERELITKALSRYQSYKFELIQKEKEIYGEHWGDANEFDKKDWTVYNDRFLQG